MTFSLRQLLIGDPLRTEDASHQRLSNLVALPIFSSDALSSVAFATEEIMAALLLAGAVPYFALTPWLSLGIVVLLVIVTVSYRQTISAYPGGGGAYTVATDNLGNLAGRSAGAALLLDYILNAAVCASAGAAAVTSLLGNLGMDLTHYTVPIALSFIILIAVINLRGTRESGAIFAVPVYGFVAMMYLVIGVGLWRLSQGSFAPVHSFADLTAARVGGHEGASGTLAPLGIFLVLHAFSSGCTALTGVEAISNGVQAFREPAPINAQKTMLWMALLLGTMFLGLSVLAVKANAIPPNAQGFEETVISQTGRAVFGTGPLYWVLQAATCAILMLSANTSFADFPRLSALMARDGYLPRQLGNIGDKLVFDRGILVLALASCALIVGFGGSVHALIPLFAIGVFLSFTLSQAGMVKRWFTQKTPGWSGRALVNGVGGFATGLVTIVFGIVKFSHGAWLIIVLIPLLVLLFWGIHRHYESAAQQLSLDRYRPAQGMRHHVFVLVPDLHRGVIPALQYARTIDSTARALHVAIDPEREARLRDKWPLYSRGVPLEIVPSPYRSLVTPVLDYITTLQARDVGCLVTIVIPEAIAASWWTGLLHGQASFSLLWRLRFRANVIATHVPYHIKAFVDGGETEMPPPEPSTRELPPRETSAHETTTGGVTL